MGWHTRAAAALARGDLAEAEANYLRALTQERAIEHEEGIASNLQGLAVTYQRAGRPAQAHEMLDLIVDSPWIRFSSEATAQALYLKASLFLDQGDAKAASATAERGAAMCPQRACAAAPRLDELRARIAIVQGDVVNALRLATAAESAATQDNDTAAIADAKRTRANALLLGSPELGLPVATEALELDKRMARPDRIAASLLLLSQLHAALGDKAQACSALSRARLVAEADGNRAGLAEARKLSAQVCDVRP